jgi:cyclophilin family peptidyl-prolyl cis-trans isomerase
VATKKEIQKRRVQAQRQAEVARAHRDRRRRLVIGGVAGTLAIAMVASLGIGFLAAGNGQPEPDDLDVELTDAPLPVELVPPEPGQTMTGDTPCPATDGTQMRTTVFETAPPTCIESTTAYDVSLTTSQGEIVVAIDTTDLTAANLFVTNSWYGVYNDVPFWLVVEDGLAITGDAGTGNPGFTVPAVSPTRPYAAGDVIMWADENGGIGSQFAFVASDLVADTLALDPAHPIVGSVASGSDVVASIITEAGAPGGIQPVADIRITAVSVTETG